MKIHFAEPFEPQSGAVVVGVWEDGALTPAAQTLDEATAGTVRRALAAAQRFKGKKDEWLPIIGPPRIGVTRIILAGLGAQRSLDAKRLRELGGNLVAQLDAAGETEATFLIESGADAPIGEPEAAAELAFGAQLRAYRFDKYRTKEKPEKKPSLQRLTVATPSSAAAKRAHRPLEKLAEAVAFARDLVSEPANVIYPETLAQAARSLAELGVKVEVLDEAAMRRLGMNALLAVGEGSARPPRLVVMEWRGAQHARGGDTAAPLAFVGKGVTFDTGGISIKPAAGMEEMKWDMAGSAVVMGLLRALASRKASVDAVGVVGLVENMPSGTAQRPGDIVVSMSGQTIEVLNTDAEGRLVLADALWYCQDRFKPRLMIDLATLTGAVIVALGHELAALFSNNDELAERLIAAGKAVGEPVWRLPLGEAYDREIDSDAADVKNIGGGRAAGSIIGAQFLQRFVNEVPWAHLDIAGVAWSKKDAAITPKGATAFGVRLLDRFVAENYEKE
jgi:leucyl aminopeptidase